MPREHWSSVHDSPTRIVLGLMLALAQGLAAPAMTQSPEVEVSISRPNLDRVEPAVRKQLVEARERLDGLLADGETEGPELASALGFLGQLYLGYDLLDPARASLVAATDYEPNTFRWQYLLGYVDARNGRADEARAAFERALETKPADPVTLVRLGNLLMEGRDYDEARSLFSGAFEADPGCVAALYGMGEAARRSGDADTALEFLTQAAERWPDGARVRYALGLTLRRLGRIEEAQAQLAQVDFKRVSLGAWEGCADPQLALIAEHTTGASVHILRGVVAAFSGNRELELAEYRLALEVDPNDAVAHKSLATALYARDDLEGAERHFREAIRLDGKNPEYRMGLAQILLRAESTAAAIVELEAAIGLNPHFKQALLLLGAVHREAGRLAQAVPHYEAVTTIDPADFAARTTLAGIYLQLGRRGDAAIALGELLDQRPPEDLEERLKMAAMLFALRDTGRAERHFRAITELVNADPKIRATAHVWLGRARLAADDAAAARRNFERALELSPDLEAARHELDKVRGPAG